MAATASPVASFLWGEGGEMKSPEQVKREREIAAALMKGGMDYSPVGHWTQGLARAAQGLAGGLETRWANEAESKGKASATDAYSSILASLGGGSPSAQPSAAGIGAAAPQGADAASIRQGLIDRGLPEHVADGFLMNFQDESGLNPGINEQNPTVAGSRGGFGLAQWTGPRRVALEQFAQQRGVDPSDTNAQLDFLMSELQGPEASAAQSFMGAPDAGSAAAAIATNFLRPAAQNLAPRVARYTAGGQPTQVASLDPSIGAPAAPQPGQQQIAQALMGGAQPQQGGGMPSMQQLAQVAGNEWLNPSQRSIIDSLLGQQMQQQDPMYQLQMQGAQQGLTKGQLEINALQHPVAPAPDPYTLSPGQIRYGTDNQPIASVPVQPDPNKAPTVQKVTLEDGSEMAVQWDGAAQKWVPINAPEGGGSLAPPKRMTENQSKLTLFQTLQEQTQPVLLDLEQQFDPANLQDAAARSTPIAGNFFQSEQGQIYNTAAAGWAEGALRIATGAAATPDEMQRTIRTYFAQPGDTPNTIAFKAQMREMYGRAINNSLGTPQEGHLPLPSEFAKRVGNSGGLSLPAAAPADTGGVVDFSDYFK